MVFDVFNFIYVLRDKNLALICFRSGKHFIKIDWLVLQNKEDIADFVIFSGGNKLEENSPSKLVPYNLRSQTVKNTFTNVK